ncbi:transposase [Haloferula chungangensis]|uniref:Transposase n=1 Tax=Haloferula chungangensis TaxID=1048331 RepID=A0ABW2L8G0_9BACT
MARGNRREDIVLDDEDRRRFVKTLAELVDRSGWRLYAWVLMDNHYHLLVRTPEANLVDGMRWFQNTWTRRFNARHRLWGHLFGGRYKAIPAAGDGYFSRLVHYIHLNPVRAGLVKKKDGIAEKVSRRKGVR